MDRTQQIVAGLLSEAIRSRKPVLASLKEDIIGGADWDAVFEEAKAHEVYPLLYPALEAMPAGARPDKRLMSRWQKAALVSASMQVRHIDQVKGVLKDFHLAGIPAIPLKGLVLRELYPHPDLRSMSDADILVPGENMEAAAEILKNRGYSYREDPYDVHITFEHSAHLTVELHRSLINRSKFENSRKSCGTGKSNCFEDFDEAAWKNCVSGSFEKISVMTLSPEDQLLHLLLHMAGHILSCGFGLRQLCDLVLLVESEHMRINWDYVRSGMEKFGISDFSQIVFSVCCQLFGMKMPAPYQDMISCSNDTAGLLIEDIFAGGVYGYRSVDRMISREMLEYGDNNMNGGSRTGSNKTSEKCRYFLSSIFPVSTIDGNRYAYAKRHQILLPAAWLHRMARFVAERGLKVFLNTILLSCKALTKTADKRTKLLYDLGLRQ